MRKAFIFFGMLSMLGMAYSQTVAERLKAVKPDNYKGYNQVTVFDSTVVMMEESGLSYVNNHQLIKILNHQGAKNNSVFKIDYDPQSAYVEIEKVVVNYFTA